MARRSLPPIEHAALPVTLRTVAAEKRRQDTGLARYFAYRIAVWKSLDKSHTQAKLARLLGLPPPTISELANGKSGSYQLIEVVARGLGPTSEDEFKQLARAWAEENPSWKAGDSLPERITRTGGPLEDGPQGEPNVFSDDLREAARAIVGLMKCKPEQARAAAEMARDTYPDHEGDWLFWLGAMRPHVERLMRGSGERPSARVKLAKS